MSFIFDKLEKIDRIKLFTLILFLAVVISELALIPQSLILSGEFPTKNLLIEGLITPLITASILSLILINLLTRSQKKSYKLKIFQKKLMFQQKYLQTILNTEDNIIVVTKGGEKLDTTNRAFLEFFEYKNINEFKKSYDCICEFFEKREGYLYKEMGELNWLRYIYKFPNKAHKVIMKKRGRDFIFSVKAKFMSFDEKERSVVVFNDITKLEEYSHNLEDEIKEQKELLETIYNSVDNGICITDENGLFIQVNKTYCDVYGYSKDELIGNDFRILIKDSQKEKALKLYKSYINNESSEFPEEWEVIDKNGKMKSIYAKMKSIVLNGRVHQITSITDLTKLKELEKKQKEQEEYLIQQSKMAQIGDMMSAIAHQWRQPLNVIALLIQDVEFKYQFNKLGLKEVERITNEGMKQIEFLSKTIDDFRNFFKPSKDKKEFLVSSSILNVLSLVTIQLRDNFINCNFMIKDEVINLNNLSIKDDFLVYGYPNEFEHALLNIINNAKDAIKNKISKKELDDEEGLIEVKLNFKDNKAIIEISDNGGGIKDELISKVFEPYFTTKFQSQGTGLGLYMTKMLIEQNMKGKVYVKNIENGAKFIIEIEK